MVGQIQLLGFDSQLAAEDAASRLAAREAELVSKCNTEYCASMASRGGGALHHAEEPRESEELEHG